MNEIETKISQRLNNAIDKIKPDDIEGILNAAESTSIKITSKRKTPFLQIGIGFAVVCIIATMSWLVISPKVINKGNNHNNLYATGLSHYQSHIYMPNCSLYFNEGTIGSSTNELPIINIAPICSEDDIIRHFGFDPLKGIWLPQELKSCFSPNNKSSYDESGKDTMYYDKIYYSTNGYWWIVADYKKDLNDINSKSICIILSSDKYPHSVDNGPAGEGKISSIYGTKVNVIYQPKGSKIFPTGISSTDEFFAKFTYKNVGYSIYGNCDSQTEFVKVLTSIIKS